MKSDRRALFGAVLSVGASCASLFAVQGTLSRFTPDGVLFSLLPYLAGYVAALFLLKICVSFLPKPDAEGEIVTEDAPRETKAPAVNRTVVISAALILLLGMNFAVYFVSGGGEARGVDELVVAASLGVLVKPALEEILFRYLYLFVLTKYGRMRLHHAVILQAVLFALWHRPSAMVFALLAGVVLGAVAAVSHDGKKDGFIRGCTDAVLVHALHNLVLYIAEAVTWSIK